VFDGVSTARWAVRPPDPHDTKQQEVLWKADHGARVLTNNSAQQAASWPLVFEAVHGARDRAAVEKCFRELEDTSSLPPNGIMAACAGMAEQQSAFHLLTNSVRKFVDPVNIPASTVAAEVFASAAAVDNFAAGMIRRGLIHVSLSWLEQATLSIPIGQIALCVLMHLRPLHAPALSATYAWSTRTPGTSSPASLASAPCARRC
jgi:hypothetical protein